MKIPIRKTWSWNEVNMAREGQLPDWQGAPDFDNDVSIHCLTPGNITLMRTFEVRWRNNGLLIDAPFWYPGRNLKAEMEKQCREADERNKVLRERFDKVLKNKGR